MANTFNFNTKLGLDAQGFKTGVNKVKNSLNGLKTSFLSLASALGAGLGFTQLISNLRDTATHLSVAMNTLKNVSYQTKVFGKDTEEVKIELTNFQENLSFVKQLANDYAQDLVSITENYAKFTAACKKTGLALEDQRNIFEALTKAAAYYHLSADRTADMMNAVTQMMSKGKITAEELRRQLGNTLPGAFNLMAAAMKVSTSELDKMMRAGEVIAEKELPKFAAMLNTVTQTAEFDSLQASMNKLKNTWYEFVERTGSEDIFKTIIDGSNKGLTIITNNIKGISSAMVGLVTYFASVNLFSFLQKQGQLWISDLEHTIKVAETRMVSLNKRIQQYEAEGSVLRNEETGAITPKIGQVIDERAARTIVDYNNKILTVKKSQMQLGIITKQEFNKISTAINQANASLTGLVTNTNTAAVSAGRLKTAWIGIGTSLTKFGKAIGTFLKSNWVFLLISALASAVSYFTKIKNEAKEIAAITEDYTNDIVKVEGTVDAEAAKLRNNLKILKNVNNSESERLIALNKINKALGLVGEEAYHLDTLDKVIGKYEEIEQKVEDWITATKKQAIIQAHANIIADATAKKADAERRKKKTTDFLISKNALSNNLWMGNEVQSQRRELKNLNKEIAEYDEAIRAAEGHMYDLGVELGEFFDEVNQQDGGGDKPLEGLAKIMSDYEKKSKELTRQLKEGAITQEEFNKELNGLIQDTYKAAAATGEVSLENILKKQTSGKNLTAVEKWYAELRDQALKGAEEILLDGIAKSIVKDIDEALAEEIKELEKEFEKILEGEEKRRQIDIDYAGATSELKYDNSRNKRDSTFDYKKTRADIFGEEANIANENLDRVMEKIKELTEKEKELMKTTGQGLGDIAKQELNSLQEYYRQLAKEAKTIEDAFRFEQIRQDIEEFNNEITSTVFGGIEDFATSMDRVVTGARELRELLENVDSTGWEKLMGVVNYIFNILNAITSVIETVNTLTELSNMLAGARSLIDDKKKADAAIELENTAAQIVAEEALSAVKSKEAIAETAITANKIEQAKATLGVATALGVEAAAYLAVAVAAKKAAAAAAAVTAAAGGPAAAVAAAEATIAGLTAVLSAFEKGGIVGGNSTRGDHNIVRVNSGEMILNKAQQGTLFNMLNGKGGLGGNVEFKIRGADLVGTINNYNSRKRG